MLEQDPMTMTLKQYSFNRIDKLFDELLPESLMLHNLRESCHWAGLPPIEVSPQQGRLLRILVQMSGAKRVLEVGTLGGYSTACLALGVGSAGHVVTLEANEAYAKIADINLKNALLDDRITILIGDATKTLPTLHDMYVDSFDFTFIDADKENNMFYVDQAVRLSHVGSIIMVDNVVRNGRVFTQTDKTEFIRRLGEHPQLDVSAIQTVGAKGWDGFVLCRVRS